MQVKVNKYRKMNTWLKGIKKPHAYFTRGLKQVLPYQTNLVNSMVWGTGIVVLSVR